MLLEVRCSHVYWLKPEATVGEYAVLQSSSGQVNYEQRTMECLGDERVDPEQVNMK